MTDLPRALRQAGILSEALRPWFGEGEEEVWRMEVDAEEALMFWERLREAAQTTGHWPVIVGGIDTDQVRLVEEAVASSTESRAEILARAATTEPNPRRWLEEELGADADVDLDGEAEARSDAWPTELESSPGVSFPYEEGPVLIALVPTPRGWEAPAYLRFGGFNGCPEPHQHVALLKDWAERYGAEAVALGGDFAEIRIQKPPRDREEALAIAKVHFFYCSDVVDQGYESLEVLAAHLLAEDVWHFWWD